MRNVILVLLTVSVFAAGCKSSSKKNMSDFDKDVKGLTDRSPGLNKGANKFSIEAPAGWTKADTSIMGMKATFLYSPVGSDDDRFRENVNVVTEGCGGYDLDEYFDLTMKNLRNMPGFEEHKLTETSFNGTDFKNLKYTHAYRGTPMDVDLYIAVKDKIAYVITASALKGELGLIAEPVNEIMQSFRIN